MGKFIIIFVIIAFVSLAVFGGFFAANMNMAEHREGCWTAKLSGVFCPESLTPLAVFNIYSQALAKLWTVIFQNIFTSFILIFAFIYIIQNDLFKRLLLPKFFVIRKNRNLVLNQWRLKRWISFLQNSPPFYIF